MSSYWNYRECADCEQVCGGTPDDEPDPGETVFGRCNCCGADGAVLVATGMCSPCTHDEMEAE